MNPTLSEFREMLGARLDHAMGRITDFTVPMAEYCDLGEPHTLGDLPAIVYYWSLRPDLKAVPYVVTQADYEAMTATSTERIPHEIVIQVKVISEEVDGADAMRDALLAEFGEAPCIGDPDSGGVPLLYGGFDDAQNEFVGGIFTYTFTYSGLIFLSGRVEENPLVTAIDLEIVAARAIEIPEEVSEKPVPELDAVTLREIATEIYSL